MKKLFFIICLSISVTSLTKAQSYTDRRVAKFQKMLDLTDEQTAKCSTIFHQQVTKPDSAEKAGATNKEVKAISKDLENQFIAILTEEQAKKYKNIMGYARTIGH